MHMRITLNISDDLLNRARSLTGIEETTALVKAGLNALILREVAARQAGKRLAHLGGTHPKLPKIPRRRSS